MSPTLAAVPTSDVLRDVRKGLAVAVMVVVLLSLSIKLLRFESQALSARERGYATSVDRSFACAAKTVAQRVPVGTDLLFDSAFDKWAQRVIEVLYPRYNFRFATHGHGARVRIIEGHTSGPCPNLDIEIVAQ